jgi:hypothetical protein
VWFDEQDPEARRQVASVALVKLPGADLEVEAGTLVVFDPLGRRVTTVAEDVRTLSHASLLDSDSILLLYERNRRYVRALIDARSFEVRSVDDISVPELE